jgi:hypothetical protein
MTDQFTSLSPAALQEIIANIDRSLAIFAPHADRLRPAELQAMEMLFALRTRILVQLENHPDRDN